MKTVRVILIVLFDVVFLGAFVFYFPALVQFLGNQITAFLVAGIMIIGSGIVIAMGFHKCRRCAPKSSGTEKGVD